MGFLGDFFRKVKDHFIPSSRNVYRPHILGRPWLIFFIAVVLTAEGVFVADLLARQSAFNFVAAVLPGEIVALTNDERAQNSVGQLQENSLLDAAAQAKANDMAAKGYFSHIGPDGKEPWAWVAGAGYDYSYAGENLAVHFVDSSDVVNAWMASPTHRANIVKPVYTQIGVGVAQGTYQGQPATFVVQYFGTPRTGVAVQQETGSAAAALQVARGQLAAAEPVSTTSAQVEGAATAPPVAAPAEPEPTSVAEPQHSDTPWSSFARELARGDVKPGDAVSWVLGGVAVFLIIGLALAFFIHIQIQASEMLIGGAVVAAVALSLFFLNAKTPFATPISSQQAASVFGAFPANGGFIDSVSATTQQ